MRFKEHDAELLVENYPTLKMSKDKDGYIFSGKIILNHTYNGVRMVGEYVIEINIPCDISCSLPIVRELSNKIDNTYPHRYDDGRLCLASDIELKLFFSHNNDLSVFIESYVIPYLYTYQYYQEYNTYPFGERSHGLFGEIEYLKEVFDVIDLAQLCRIMIYMVQTPYRGHHLCPCGSNKKIRNCHGNIIRQFIDAELLNDCKEIIYQVMELSELHKNGKHNQTIKKI